MKSSHYCIEGCRHDDQCDCDCPSCENHRRQHNQYLINKKLYDKIREDGKRMQSFVDNIIKTKTKGFEMFGEQECRQVESLIRKEFGEEYFLAINIEKCSVVKYKSLGGDVERDFGWFASPQEAYRAAKGVLGK